MHLFTKYMSANLLPLVVGPSILLDLSENIHLEMAFKCAYFFGWELGTMIKNVLMGELNFQVSVSLLPLLRCWGIS